MLRVLLRVGEPCISQGHSCGGDRELGISIEPFKTMRGKIIFRDPPRNFSGTMRVEFGGIKTGNCSDSTLLRSNATPEIFAPDAHRSNRTYTRYDRATSCHFAELKLGVTACSSRYVFMQ